jgi:predicted nucleic acid-binding Zn ribbon protein
MRKSQTQNISQIISAILKANGLEDKLAETRIIQSWEELLGKSVARLTKSMYIKNRTLFVSLNSSVVRSELTMIKKDLLIRLNEKAGKCVIDDIVLR